MHLTLHKNLNSTPTDGVSQSEASPFGFWRLDSRNLRPRDSILDCYLKRGFPVQMFEGTVTVGEGTRPSTEKPSVQKGSCREECLKPFHGFESSFEV